MLDRAIRVQNGPASSAVTRPRRAPASLPGAALGIDERTKIVKAIGRDQARGNQFPESSLDFGFEFAGCANDIGKERSTALLQIFEDLLCDRAQALSITGRRMRSHPVRLFANKERDGSDAGRNHATTSIAF